MKPGKAWIVVVLCAFAFLGIPPALAAGRSFDPRPLSESVYGVTAPGDEDALDEQRDYVTGSEDTPLYVETYLPKPLPPKLPVVLIASGYEGTDPLSPIVAKGPQRHHETMARYWAARGYVVSIAHLRGTGKSGGCIDIGGAREQGDLAELVEWAGRETTWTNGKVGMYGASYTGLTQLEAATSADRRKTHYLKAIVPIAPPTGAYAQLGYDGVMDSIATPLSPLAMLVFGAPRAEAIAQDDLLADLKERPGCHGEHLEGTTDFSGNFNAWYREREHRSRVERIRAATLYAQGLYDTNVYPTQVEGFFDRIPSDTPHKAIIGQWAHAIPDSNEEETKPPFRKDWNAMATAWLDRWVKGLPTGAEDWPTVQVQDSAGQWRAEPGFPATTGQSASLALGRPEEPLGNGTLGALRPTGSTTYREDSVQGPGVGTAPIGGRSSRPRPSRSRCT